MAKRNPNRQRTKTLTVRLSENEYNEFYQQYKESGYPTIREYLLGKAGCRFYTDNDKQELQELNKTVSDFDVQLRGMATNINQMAHWANIHQAVPEKLELTKMFVLIQDLRKEASDIWESIRLVLRLENPHSR